MRDSLGQNFRTTHGRQVALTGCSFLLYNKALTAGTHIDISAVPSSGYFYTWIITEHLSLSVQ